MKKHAIVVNHPLTTFWEELVRRGIPMDAAWSLTLAAWCS